MGQMSDTATCAAVRCTFERLPAVGCGARVAERNEANHPPFQVIRLVVAEGDPRAAHKGSGVLGKRVTGSGPLIVIKEGRFT